MAVIIDGTNGITSVNGTAAAPSVTGTDTDTGIVYGTNTLSLATGGTTAVTVDSSQNVGIGTSSPLGKVGIQGPTQRMGFNVGTLASPNAGNLFYETDGTGWDFRIGKYQSGSFTAQMTLTDSGNVGIGTASPSQKLHVYGATSTYGRIESVNAGTGAGLTFKNATSNWLIGAGPASGLSEFAIVDQTSGSVARLYIDTSGNLQFNSGYGSVATAYGCRAWVNFNGTGTVAIRASGNVSSITDNGTGDYTVNFSTGMPDTSYTPVVSVKELNTTAATSVFPLLGAGQTYATAFTTSSIRVATQSGTTRFDCFSVCLAVFR